MISPRVICEDGDLLLIALSGRGSLIRHAGRLLASLRGILRWGTMQRSRNVPNASMMFSSSVRVQSGLSSVASVDAEFREPLDEEEVPSEEGDGYGIALICSRSVRSRGCGRSVTVS